MNNKSLYNYFHEGTNSQKKIIKKNNFTYRLIITVIEKYLVNIESKVLDIGCGAGTLSLYLGKKGYEVMGIDVSDKAIISSNESAKYMKLNNVKFRVYNFPYEIPKKKFDIILFTEVIEHLKDDYLALNKIYSMTNKNGILILSTPSKNAPLYKLGLLNKFDKEVGHLRRYYNEELISILNKAGFIIVENYKVEGLLRNFLFTNSIAGKSIKFIKGPLSDFVTYIDQLFLSICGESNYIIVAKREI